MRSTVLLRLVLAAAGGFIVFTGVNIGFGGMRSLGRLGSNQFLTVTDSTAFAVQDSHVRFVGGVWLALGLTFMAGAVRLASLRKLLLFGCGLIFLGGFARFSSGDLGSLVSPRLIGSLGAELIGMPVLALWIWRSGESLGGRRS